MGEELVVAMPLWLTESDALAMELRLTFSFNLLPLFLLLFAAVTA